MEWYWILLLLLGSILILMFVGVPVGIAFVIVCTVTAYLLYGRFRLWLSRRFHWQAHTDMDVLGPEEELGSSTARS